MTGDCLLLGFDEGLLLRKLPLRLDESAAICDPNTTPTQYRICQMLGLIPCNCPGHAICTITGLWEFLPTDLRR
jgi:hypothetical protein